MRNYYHDQQSFENLGPIRADWSTDLVPPGAQLTIHFHYRRFIWYEQSKWGKIERGHRLWVIAWWLMVNRMVSNVVLVNHWINFHQLKKNRIFNRLWERINKTLKSAKRKIWAVWINWIRLNSLMMTHIICDIYHDSFIWLIDYGSQYKCELSNE